MSTSVASVVSFFPSAQNGFTTTLASTITSGAATVPLNSVAGYSNGEIAVMVVDPTDASKKQTFTGVVDTAGVQLTSVVWTAGTNQTHTGGSTVVDYATATHISMMTKGLLVEHAQAGTHAAATITSRTEDTTPASGDFLLTYDISATALKKVTRQNFFDNAPTGFPLQVVSTNSSAVATGTTTVPFDDTIPQNTEGDQYMTQAITPKATTNTLLIEVTMDISNSAAGTMTAALFQDSTANALAAVSQSQSLLTGMINLKLTHSMTAGTTSATTFKIRAGLDGAGTTTFNGNATARRYGGITVSNIKITEYKA